MHSENFAKWLKKHDRAGLTPIFAAISQRSILDGSDVEYDPRQTQASQIIIGFGDIDDGYIHGSRLSEIICNGGRAKTWAFGPEYKFLKLDGWVEGYQQYGVCFIDPEHILYSNWDMINDHRRKCKHCGFEQIRITQMVPRYTWEKSE